MLLNLITACVILLRTYMCVCVHSICTCNIHCFHGHIPGEPAYIHVVVPCDSLSLLISELSIVFAQTDQNFIFNTFTPTLSYMSRVHNSICLFSTFCHVSINFIFHISKLSQSASYLLSWMVPFLIILGAVYFSLCSSLFISLFCHI